MAPDALLALLDSCPNRGLNMTTDGPWEPGSGIRPELLSVNQAGGHNYHLTKRQAVRFAEKIRSELALIEGEG